MNMSMKQKEKKYWMNFLWTNFSASRKSLLKLKLPESLLAQNRTQPFVILAGGLFFGLIFNAFFRS